jgi:hypothetical protein
LAIQNKNEQLVKLASASIKLRDVVERNREAKKADKEEEIIRFPFLVVEYIY